MQEYQKTFIQLSLASHALRFGEFTLKSGRVSPYFFNAGAFNTGGALATLGDCYAERIVESGIAFDMLFGPAYKGIPLAAAAAISLSRRHGIDVPWAFNRKEDKDHGEGGRIVGAPLAGRVLIIDDVITAGTAILESVAIIRDGAAEPAGVALALDRQERGQGERSAVQEVEHNLSMPVTSILTLADLVEHLEQKPDQAGLLSAMQAYRDQYGVRA